MQGIKNYEETFFLNFQLSNKVPTNNFYQRLQETLDLSFVRKLTVGYYGKEGQTSIDPVVFFKLMLIGYIENINSDRKIVEQSSMRMDMLYFLGYNLDEPLPWHSTLSRTRQLYGEELFLSVFRKILSLCVSAGMVDGHRQAIDSAFIKAHVSYESIQHQLEVNVKAYYQELDETAQEPATVSAPRSKKRQNDLYGNRVDPDAKLARKRGKPKAFNYYGQLSVDTASHVICGAKADFADQRDAQCLPAIVDQTMDNLSAYDKQVKEVLADTNYSSGPALQYLEEKGIDAYIPNVGNYQPQKKGFTYLPQEDCYLCAMGNKLTFKMALVDKRDHSENKMYYSSTKDCKQCSIKSECLKRSKVKCVSATIHRPYYQRMHEKLQTAKGKRMRKIRSSTVEPVLGTLLHFRGMKKVRTKGIQLANKHVLLAASAYNLKKLMAFLASKNTAAMALTKQRTRQINDCLEQLVFLSCFPMKLMVMH